MSERTCSFSESHVVIENPTFSFEDDDDGVVSPFECSGRNGESIGCCSSFGRSRLKDGMVKTDVRRCLRGERCAVDGNINRGQVRMGSHVTDDECRCVVDVFVDVKLDSEGMGFFVSSPVLVL